MHDQHVEQISRLRGEIAELHERSRRLADNFREVRNTALDYRARIAMLEAAPFPNVEYNDPPTCRR